MKAIFIVPIIVLYTFSAKAQSLLLDSDVPKIVKDSLTKIYPEIQNPNWFLVKENYEAVYDTDRAILLTAYGNVIAEMNTVLIEGIPEAILRYFKLNEPNTKLVSSRRMVMYEDGRVYYIVNSTKQYYKFNTKGQVIEKANL